VVLKDARGKLHPVPAADIDSLVPSRESLMPSGAFADLTPQQAADVIAYLSGKK